MPQFCLTKTFTDKFLKGLKSGEIDPQKLASMTSEERRAFFSKMFNEDVAKNVNALFESKLLLKNQKQGMITWAKTVGGLNKEAKKDLVSRINRLDKVLNPEEEKAFLEDLAAKKLGIDVSQEEAKKIFDLAKKAEDLRLDSKKRIEYGNALLDFYDYTDSLNPNRVSLAVAAANIPKTLMSSLDFSAGLRQGWGMMTRKEWYLSFVNQFKYAFSKKAFRDLQADIISRPSYDLMKSSGLRISSLATKLAQKEEDFIGAAILRRLPWVGASERAYVGFLNKLRADVFDHLVKSAELAGENVSKGSKELNDIANTINDFTGSGNIGKGDRYASAVPLFNAGLFSPRKISATVNMFNPARYLDPRISKTARKAALRQLIGSLSATATFMGLASMAGADIETNPISSDFGKIKIGNTRFDVSGGNANYLTLLSRLAENKTKSTTTGKVRELGKGYKADNRGTLILKFGRNKLSPLAGELVSLITGSDFMGKPVDIKKDALEMITPMIVGSVMQMAAIDKDIVPIGILAELFGVGVQSY